MLVGSINWRSAMRRAPAIRTVSYVLFFGVFAAVLAACSKKPAAKSNAAPVGQVIAHVGKQDVTISELENEFRWASIPPGNRNDELVHRILGDLVKRKYLTQKAVTAGLDREPNVLLDTMKSREQILATAYVQRSVATQSAGIGTAELNRYIVGNPLKFDKRVTLTVDQITIPLSGNIQATLDATKDLSSLEEVDQKLSELGILHTRSTGLLNSSDVPPDFFNAIQARKADDVFFVRSGPTATFFKVKAQSEQPLTGEDAARVARQQLISRLLQEATTAPPAADIEIKYEGDYARIMAEKEAPKADGTPEDQPKKSPDTPK